MIDNEDLYIEKKQKVWDIIRKNENHHYLKTMSNFPKLKEKSVKKKPKTVQQKNRNPIKIPKTIHRKVIPLFVDKDEAIYERDTIMHKFHVFEDERNKRFNTEKMKNLFNKLFSTKTRRLRIRENYTNENLFSLKSPEVTSKKFYLSYQNSNNIETSEFPNITQENNDPLDSIKKFEKKNTYEDNNDDLDSCETDERIIKQLEDDYPFFNKEIDEIGKQRKQVQKLFRNNKDKIDYFHHVDKIKRAHFMDLSPENIINSNLTQTKFPTFNNTISKFSRSKDNFGKKYYLNTTTGFNFLKNNLLNKTNPSHDLNIYAKKIIENIIENQKPKIKKYIIH